MTKTRNGGKWTDARYKSFVVSALRGAFRRWPPKSEAVKQAFVEKKVNEKSGRIASFYRCASCKNTFVLKDIQVDHKKPVIDVKKGFENWEKFIERLFCERNNLQVMCKTCHSKKTKKERSARATKKPSTSRASPKS